MSSALPKNRRVQKSIDGEFTYYRKGEEFGVIARRVLTQYEKDHPGVLGERHDAALPQFIEETSW